VITFSVSGLVFSVVIVWAAVLAVLAHVHESNMRR
jgi:hypothetical protein